MPISDAKLVVENLLGSGIHADNAPGTVERDGSLAYKLQRICHSFQNQSPYRIRQRCRFAQPLRQLTEQPLVLSTERPFAKRALNCQAPQCRAGPEANAGKPAQAMGNQRFRI